MEDEQGELNFDPEPGHGAARWSDPETSHEAAESIDPTYLYGVIRDTLAWAHAHPALAARALGVSEAEASFGLTSHEIAHLSRKAYGSLTPRMKTMRKRDWIYDTGITRPWGGAPNHPRSTRQSTVWQLTSLRSEKHEFTEKKPE